MDRNANITTTAKHDRKLSIPNVLADKFAEYIKSSMSTVLIAEYERYSEKALDKILSSHPAINFTLVTQLIEPRYPSCIQRSNVKLLSANMYNYDFTDQKFDLILSVPAFAAKRLSTNGVFISDSSELIAAENLLYHLNVGGELVIVLPAKTAFARNSSLVNWRRFVAATSNIEEISALPGGLFSPATAIRTYLFVFSNDKAAEGDTVLKRYEAGKSASKNGPCEELIENGQKLRFKDEFSSLDDWNIDMAFLVDDDEDIKKFMEPTVAKRRLGEAARIFRGKAVKEQSKYGNIGVINISNITETGINYSDICSIEEDERKVAGYILQEGDVLVTARGGPTIKIAVFEEQKRPCIPSVNIIVIRPERALHGVYLKMFLESAAGMKMLTSLQRGEKAMNINYEDLKELDIPALPIGKQEELVNEYNSGLEEFKAAKESWEKIRRNIQENLFPQDFIVK